LAGRRVSSKYQVVSTKITLVLVKNSNMIAMELGLRRYCCLKEICNLPERFLAT